MISFVTYIVGCIGWVAAIIFDHRICQYVCGFTTVLSLFATPLAIIGGIMHHSWGKTIAGIGAVAGALLLGFFAAVIIGVGQYRPPKHDLIEPYDSTGVTQNTFGEDVILTVDSTESVKNHLRISSTVKADYPTDNPKVLDQLITFIKTQMFYDEDGTPRGEMPVYKGNFKSFILVCANKRWAELRADTYGDEYIDPEEIKETSPLSTAEYSFTKIYDRGSFASWQCRWYFYIDAAARPNMATRGMTINKKTGKPLDHKLLKDTDSPAFRQLLKEGVRRWVATEMRQKVDTDEELQQFLFRGKDINQLPLPQQPPYLSNKGVVLPYQDYELLPVHDAQLIVLPYDKVRPFLTIISE